MISERINKYSFEEWKEKNWCVLQKLYELLLESCENEDLKIYVTDDFRREVFYYFYHHAQNASCDTVLIQGPEDEEEEEETGDNTYE